ncbi:MAG TPA: lysine--tRNA ligase [Polyangiaceae bacterium]|nr:lysine--tRNA ligase [Polyangiaceae bacterium]
MSDKSASVSSGSSEEALIATRRAKADKLREQGQNPFANDEDVTDRSQVHALRERCAGALLEPKADLRYDPERVVALTGDASVKICGRVIARRGFGKASFIRIRDASGEMQLFAKQDELGEFFHVLEDLDVGDHVVAEGPVIATKTGELSIGVRRLRLLAKALRPLPDKWHGLTDVEQRYRHRYIDMVANPEVAVVLRARGIIVQGVRAFLDGEGFLEVETPTLHTLIGGAAARPFNTKHNTLDLDLFLRIAPELYLKRLLVGGLERVYEIGRCYRNEGISTRHNPEFTMLEFYQAYATYEVLMEECERMFRFVDEFLATRLKAAGLEAQYQKWLGERPFTLSEPFKRVPMKLAVERSLTVAGLPTALTEKFAALGRVTDDKQVLAEIGGWIKEWKAVSERAARIDWTNLRRALTHCDSDGERWFVAYEYLAEPFLSQDYRSKDGGKSVPVFILDYPAAVSPLARRKDSDASLVDRFELFVDGRELCNAFSELNDPDDQAARFRDQVERKQRGQEETMDYDADYIRALEQGMPPAAGFGLGVDRFVMALTGQPSIRDVIAFPLLRPETDR